MRVLDGEERGILQGLPFKSLKVNWQVRARSHHFDDIFEFMVSLDEDLCICLV